MKFARNNKEYKQEKKERMINIRKEYEKKTGKTLGFQRGKLNPSSTPEGRERIRKARKNQKITSIQKKRISRSMKRALKDPALLAKWSRVATGRKHTKETIRKMVLTKAKKPKSRKTLVHILDRVFALYIRERDSDWRGHFICITCHRTLPKEQLDCGHYVSRAYYSLRWEEKNAHGQCRSCNRFKQGAMDEYALSLQEKYGDSILKEFRDKKNINKVHTNSEIEELIEDYKIRVKDLER